MDRYAIATALPRGLHIAASLSLFGCLVFRRFVVPRGAVELPLGAMNLITSCSAALALVAGGIWLTAVSGTIADASNLTSLLAAVPLVACHTSFGNFVCGRLLLLAGVLIALAFRGPRARFAALLMSGVALTPQPMLGHIGASDGSGVLIPIEIAHLLAAGAWLGSLPPLLVCVVCAPPAQSAELCDRFTPVGLVAVGTIAVTALPQAGALIGGIPELFGTPYGHMAIIKLALFLLAVGLACVNRLVLTTRLRSDPARRALIGSIAIETVAVLGVVLAAGAMATLPPAVHEQPVWPFAWRPNLVPWSEQPTWPLALAACGLVAIGVSLVARRLRVLAVGLAMIAVIPFARAPGMLLVEAWPTSYAQSTTGFSVSSIARGSVLFGSLCAACHEARAGSGDEADLTAPHIWTHLDGELFWWVTNGILDPKGAAVMPGFGSILSEDDRWALIDFVHAWNVGQQTANTGHWSPPVAAPATPLICAGRDADTLADLATQVVIIDVGADRPAENGLDPLGAEPANPSDTITIRLPRGTAGEPRTGECVVASEDARAAWQLLAGVAGGRFAGYRAIIDGQGWLRAWLRPDATSDQVLAAIRDIREHPVTEGGRLARHH